MPSSIAIGDHDSMDLKGELVVRECTNDRDYPFSLEGVTQGGHDVILSLDETDTFIVYHAIKEYYGI